MEVAERTTHDLFKSVKMYTSAIPRLRLFASFFGLAGFDDSFVAAGELVISG